VRDMLLMTESARSAAYYAAWALTEDAPEASGAVSIAKAFCSDAYRGSGQSRRAGSRRDRVYLVSTTCISITDGARR